MSESILRVIPVEPTFVPEYDAQQAARAFALERFPAASDVRARTSGSVTFVDSGEPLEVVRCPLCGVELDAQWWTEAVDRARARAFANLTIKTPCCDQWSTLNDLEYWAPVGFAQFVLEVTDPMVSRVSDATVARIGELLGCEVRLVR